jgi:hypothetical protein
MKNLTKALVGTVAAGAMAVSTATPALAKHDDGGGISAGEVIAGALVIGGIAAVAAAASKDRNGYEYHGDYRGKRGYRYGRGYGYGPGYSPRAAVEQCVSAAQRDTNRYVRGRARVTEITSVNYKRDGWDVKGRIVVDSRYRGYDRGKFKCKVRYGRIADLDFSGIRGLR